MQRKLSESEQEILKHIIRAVETEDLEEMLYFIPCFRTQMLVRKLVYMRGLLEKTETLINPPIQIDIQVEITENLLANIQRNYYRRYRNEIIDVLDKMSNTIIGIFSNLFETEPQVIDQTNLPENLKRLYENFIVQLQRLERNITVLADASIEMDEIIKTTADVRSTWANIKLLLNHQLIYPLFSSILEVAKKTALQEAEIILYRGGRSVEKNVHD